MANRVVRNVLSNWMGLCLNMVIAFFMSPFLVHNLGDAMYGLRALTLSLTGYMGLLDVGLRVSVVKQVAQLHALGDDEELNRTVSSSLAIYGGVAALVVAATFGLQFVFTKVFVVAPDVVPTARIVVWLSGASFAVSLMNSVFAGFVLGLQRYDLGNASGMAILLARTAAIVAFVSQGYGIVTVSLIHLTAQVANGLWLVWLAFRLHPALRVSWRRVNRASTRSLYGYGVFVLMNNVAMLLLFRSGEVVTGMFIGTAAVTYYAVAGSLTEYLAKIVGTMTQVLHPRASAQSAKSDLAGIRTSIIVGTKMCLLIALPASVGFIVLGHRFIAAWMGPTYADHAAPLLAVLTLARLAWLSQSATGNIMLGVGQHKLLTTLNLATGLLSIVGSIILVQHYGLVGVVVGAAVPMIFMQGIVVSLWTTRVLDIPLRKYASGALARPLLGTLPFAVSLVALTQLINPRTLLSIFITVLAAAPSLVVAVYFVSFEPRERRRYLQAFVPTFLSPLKGSR